MALSERAAHRKDVGKVADMQHRHFATVATIISRLEGVDRQAVAEQFANALRPTNPNFNRDRFIRACLVKA